MNIEFLDRLKRERDISIKAMLSGLHPGVGWSYWRGECLLKNLTSNWEGWEGGGLLLRITLADILKSSFTNSSA